MTRVLGKPSAIQLARVVPPVAANIERNRRNMESVELFDNICLVGTINKTKS